MASVRLNIFENQPLFHVAGLNVLLGVGSLHIHGIEMPGSISFNNIAMIGSQGHTSQSASLSFGLYSLNGNTLSLANSASRSVNLAANGLSWLTIATSAEQDITPGNWYLAVMSSTGGNNSLTLILNTVGIAGNAGYGGVFARGWMSVSTSALPSSIATSDLVREDTGPTTNALHHPYILISA